MKATPTNPYLKPGRLADVLAAIQAMAVSPQYRQSVEDWAFYLVGDVDVAKDPTKFRANVERLRQMFEEHREFFRPSGANPGEFALILRRGMPRRFDIRKNRVVDELEYSKLSDEEKARLGRSPLTVADMKTMTDIAISLHEAATDRIKDSRWWLQLATPVVASVIVGLLSFAAVYLKAK